MFCIGFYMTFNIFKLLLPAIIPSWRFFDVIAPSPRIQFSLLNSADDTPTSWTEFRPRPVRIGLFELCGRLFWNARWNESLYLVSCAERLMQEYTEHSEDEILVRIKRDLIREQNDHTARYLQFRLVFLQRVEKELTETTGYVSRLEPLTRQNTT